MKRKIFISLIATAFLVGCGGSGGSSSDDNQNDTQDEVTDEVANSSKTELTAVDNKVIVPNDGKEYTYKEHKLKCLDDGKVSYDSSITSKSINMNGLIYECKNSATVSKSYNLTVTATTARNASGSSECKNADGEFTIKDHKMVGTVHDGWGKDYTINATEKDGVIEDGAFAFAAGGNAATFTGVVNTNDVSGTWEDILGCKGTWVGTAK